MTKQINNPIIGALSVFLNTYNDPMNNYTGKDREPHPGIKNNLGFLTSSIHRNLYEKVVTSKGTYPGIKERMDDSQKRLQDLMIKHDGDTAGAMSDPDFLRAEDFARVDEAAYDFMHTLFVWFTEAYKEATNEEWKPAAAPEVTKPKLTPEQEAALVKRLEQRLAQKAAAA